MAMWKGVINNKPLATEQISTLLMLGTACNDTVLCIVVPSYLKGSFKHSQNTTKDTTWQQLRRVNRACA